MTKYRVKWFVEHIIMTDDEMRIVRKGVESGLEWSDVLAAAITSGVCEVRATTEAVKDR